MDYRNSIWAQQIKYNTAESKKQLYNENMIRKNEWDMGKDSKDGIYFPLSDSWRKEENRIKDST
ncbi:MAG: hypothetical protein LBC62_11045, partial [Treponema sp.]|nr:hypothetical protein [Treponema sp.]